MDPVAFVMMISVRPAHAVGRFDDALARLRGLVFPAGAAACSANCCANVSARACWAACCLASPTSAIEAPVAAACWRRRAWKSCLGSIVKVVVRPAFSDHEVLIHRGRHFFRRSGLPGSPL